MYIPGTGVVIFAAVYLKLVRKTFAMDGAVRSDIFKKKTLLPFVFMYTGKRTMARYGFFSIRIFRSVDFVFGGGSY